MKTQPTFEWNQLIVKSDKVDEQRYDLQGNKIYQTNIDPKDWKINTDANCIDILQLRGRNVLQFCELDIDEH